MAQLNVRIPDDIQKRLKLMAVRYEMPLQSLVNSMITLALPEWEEDAPDVQVGQR